MISTTSLLLKPPLTSFYCTPITTCYLNSCEKCCALRHIEIL